MLTCAFKQPLDQHVYEGVIRILYHDMSDTNLAQVLSFMVDRELAVIKNDIARYYNADESQYLDVRKQLISCGYDDWLNEE
ncbi:hypothetical protein [Chitinophaga sp.]|uniref:hypothetical protein n=1 Tax=Chitinophaga sp. TaxID=1869181 RepID=UPI0031E3FA33